MPIHRWNFQATGQPQLHLATFGLRLQVEISIHRVARTALEESNLPIPQSVSGSAVIDTGATKTSIDENVAKTIGLHQIGRATLGTAAGPRDAPVFAFTMSLHKNFEFNVDQRVGCDLAGQGIIALIGMDLLNQAVLIVDGPAGSFTIAY